MHRFNLPGLIGCCRRDPAFIVLGQTCVEIICQPRIDSVGLDNTSQTVNPTQFVHGLPAGVSQCIPARLRTAAVTPAGNLRSPLHCERRLAEREGFEPSIGVTPYAGLANLCLQPLGHLSGCCVKMPLLKCAPTLVNARAFRKADFLIPAPNFFPGKIKGALAGA